MTSLLSNKIGYASGAQTEDQTKALTEALEHAGCTKSYTDPGLPDPGATAPGLNSALSHISAGDILVIPALNLLAHGIPDLCLLLDRLATRGALVQPLEVGPDVPPASAQHLASLTRSLANFPKPRAPQQPYSPHGTGPKLGPAFKLKPHQIHDAADRLANGTNRKDIARELDVSDATLVRALRRHGLPTHQSTATKSRDTEAVP